MILVNVETWQTCVVNLDVGDVISRCTDVISEGGALEEVATLGPVVTLQLQQQPVAFVILLHGLGAVFGVRGAAGALFTSS